MILGYHAQVDPAALGLGPLLFIELTLSCQSDEVFDRTRQALRILPGVLECHLVAGGFDYLVKARVADLAAGPALLGRVLAAVPVPAQARSYVVLEDLRPSEPLVGSRTPSSNTSVRSGQRRAASR